MAFWMWIFVGAVGAEELTCGSESEPVALTACSSGVVSLICPAEEEICYCKTALSLEESCTISSAESSPVKQIVLFQKTDASPLFSLDSVLNQDVSLQLSNVTIRCLRDANYINAPVFELSASSQSVTLTLNNVRAECFSTLNSPLLEVSDRNAGNLAVSISNSQIDWSSAGNEGKGGVFYLDDAGLTLTNTLVQNAGLTSNSAEGQLLHAKGSSVVTIQDSVVQDSTGTSASLLSLTGDSSLNITKSLFTLGGDSKSTTLVELDGNAETTWTNTLAVVDAASALGSFIAMGGNNVEVTLNYSTLLGASAHTGVNNASGMLNLSHAVFSGIGIPTTATPSSADGSWSDQDIGFNQYAADLRLMSLTGALEQVAWSAWSEPAAPTACWDADLCIGDVAAWPSLCSPTIAAESGSASVAGFLGAADTPWWDTEAFSFVDDFVVLRDEDWVCPSVDHDCFEDLPVDICAEGAPDPACRPKRVVEDQLCVPDSDDSGPDDSTASDDTDLPGDSGQGPYKPSGCTCGERSSAEALVFPGAVLLWGLQRRFRVRQSHQR